MSGSTTWHCALCGAPARAPFHAPQPEVAPDLDLRPGEPARSMLQDWLQSCGSCGAVAPDLSALPASAKPVVQSAAYQALLTSVSEETLPFRRWAMICRRTGDAEEAIEATLQAAWAADDAVNMTEAVTLRRDVAAAWDNARELATQLRRLDVLRRAGDFTAAEALAAKLASAGLDKPRAAIVAFQREHIAARDVGRHLLSSALPASEHGPHATQLMQPLPNFWHRLLGA
ncbi:MAG TPA: hypothetical protein VGG99_29990 [Acetobacteraceae bacterium]|jgi:hypothetical protein